MFLSRRHIARRLKLTIPFGGRIGAGRVGNPLQGTRRRPYVSPSWRVAAYVAGMIAALLLVSAVVDAAQTREPVAMSSDMSLLIEHINELVRIETWRDEDSQNEEIVRANLRKIQGKMQDWIDQFRQDNRLKNHKPEFFEWMSDDKEYWVFGYRVGKGKRKLSFLTHLDTVGPGSLAWKPFEPRQEQRMYRGSVTTFLVGRGAIDDKGPAVVTLDVLLQFLKQIDDQSQALNGVTLELLFDTSEETELSTPKYYDKNPDAKPTLGIVFDAEWCIHAEKGIERPSFYVAKTLDPEQGVWIEDFRTSKGPTNQTPTSATARITGRTGVAHALLDHIAAHVTHWYRVYEFDDPSYQSATLLVKRDGDDVILTTNVAGAQHGSAPDENRAKGANPLVSLANFLAHLADEGVLKDNHFTQMSRFIQWGWGTTVFGEKHPGLLYRYDTIFKEGNGTTYAITQLVPEDKGVRLSLDIRYAIGHHAQGWDGKEGLIPGDSLFQSVFQQLVERYLASPRGIEVTFDTRTLAAPDIRSPRNEFLTAVNNAYREVIGESCPMHAIGGGTDAKGHPELVAAGALFTKSLGPPINFHGLNEGAPLIDLENSAKILLRMMLNAVEMQ
jgi:succinyl-diaminopimelate desuccinylase